MPIFPVDVQIVSSVPKQFYGRRPVPGLLLFVAAIFCDASEFNFVIALAMRWTSSRRTPIVRTASRGTSHNISRRLLTLTPLQLVKVPFVGGAAELAEPTVQRHPFGLSCTHCVACVGDMFRRCLLLSLPDAHLSCRCPLGQPLTAPAVQRPPLG